MNQEGQILADIARIQQERIGYQGYLNRVVGFGFDASRSNGSLLGTGGSQSRGNPEAGDDAPWISPPHGSYPFFPKTQVPVPAVGASSIALTMQVPNGQDGVIKKFSFNYIGGGFVNGSGDLVWRILIDGRAARNASNIQSEMGTQDAPFELTMPIRIYSGQTIQIQISHVANVTLNEDTLVMLEGYFYPARGG